VGIDPKRLELRWAFLRLACGGLDLTAIEAAFLISYNSRLNALEAVLLGIAIGIGVLQTGQFGLVTTILEFAKQLCHTSTSLVLTAIAATCFRAVLFLPLYGGCPNFPWQAMLWSASLVIVWAPALAFYDWRRRARRDALHKLREMPDAPELISPSPKSESSNPALTDGSRIEGTAGTAGESSRPKTGASVKSFGKPFSASFTKGFGRASRGDTLMMMRVLSPEQQRAKSARQQERANRKSTSKVGKEMLNRLRTATGQQASWAVTALKAAKAGKPINFGDAEPLPAAVARLLQHVTRKLAEMGSDPDSPQGMQHASDRDKEEQYAAALAETNRLAILLQDLTRKRNLRNRVQHLVSAIDLIRDIRQILLSNDKPEAEIEDCDVQLLEMRGLISDLCGVAQDEYRHAAVAHDAVRIARSAHFRLGTMKDRAELMDVTLPYLPRLHLVHWRTLVSLERLPAYTEKTHLTPADEALASSGHNFVAIAVIHSWRTDALPDPDCTTAKQLIIFAHWYRQQWGWDLEPYFWIDYCCLPAMPDSDGAHAQGKVQMPSGEPRQHGMPARALLDQPEKKLPTILDSPGPNVDRMTPDTRSKLQHLSGLGLITDEDEEREESIQSTYDAAALDAILPLVFASSDAVVICESRESTKQSWVCAKMALAHSFASGGCTPYVIDRHIGRPKKQKSEHQPMMTLDGGAELMILDNPGALNPWGENPGALNPWADTSLDSTASSLNKMESTTMSWKQMKHEIHGIQEEPGFSRQVSGDSNMGSPFNMGSPLSRKGSAWRSEGSGRRDRSAHGVDFGEDMESESDDDDKPLVVSMKEWVLADPLDVENTHVDNPVRDRPRLVRVVSMCTAAPAASLSGDFHRSLLDFGTTSLPARRLEYQAKPELRRQMDSAFSENSLKKLEDEQTKRPETASDDDSKEEIVPADKTAGNKGIYQLPEVINKKEIHFSRNKQSYMAWEDDKLALYYSASRPHNFNAPHAAPRPADRASTPLDATFDERVASDANKSLALRQAATARSGDTWGGSNTTGGFGTTPLQKGYIKSPMGGFHVAGGTAKSNAPAAPPSSDGPRPKRFHAEFYSATVKMRSDGRLLEQLHAWHTSGGPRDTAKLGTTNLPPAGGMALTEKPLEIHAGVAPDRPQARGVAFEVTVRAVDSRWDDGIGIGFTAQDPAQWPPRRRKPGHASQMLQTWVGGYTGRWFFEKRSEFMRGIGLGKAWAPGELKVGDVVAVVAAGVPADALRIFVNGRLVAEESASKAGMPDPATTPLWGAVDIDGACNRVLLGRAERGYKDSGEDPVPTTAYHRRPMLLQGRTGQNRLLPSLHHDRLQ